MGAVEAVDGVACFCAAVHKQPGKEGEVAANTSALTRTSAFPVGGVSIRCVASDGVGPHVCRAQAPEGAGAVAVHGARSRPPQPRVF